MSEIVIQGRRLGPNHPPLKMLEAGINHNGRLDLAIEMIHQAKQLGADVIKFQTFRAEEVVSDPTLTYTYKSQGVEVTESMLNLFKRQEFARADWHTIKRVCDDAGIIFLSTPQNVSDLDILMEVGVSAIKVGSDDFINLPLLKTYAATGLPLILSIGMADMDEVCQVLDVVGFDRGYPVSLLVCTAQYPTPPIDANLRRIATLRAAYPNLVVGFSDHTQGAVGAALAVGMGASIFEKHFTLDHDLPGPDHWFSEDPHGAAEWIEAIQGAYTMLGSGQVRPSQAELEMRVLARRSITASRDIAQDELLTVENLCLRRPGDGLPPSMLDAIIGKKAARPIGKSHKLASDDFR